MAESLAAAVGQGRPLVGTVLTLPGATAAELVAEAFDVVWIDLEHASLGPLEAQEMILGAQAAQAYGMARLPAGAHDLMTIVLDAGADGIVLANVTDPQEAHSAMDRVVHPPSGSRGWGPRRLALRHRQAQGKRPPTPSVWAQIETTTGVERAAEIAGVPGIDALVVGTADLSFSLAAPLEFRAPELLEAIDAVRVECAAGGAALGVAGALDRLPAAAHAGASILVHSTDARIYAEAVDDAAAWLQSLADPDQEHATP